MLRKIFFRSAILILISALCLFLIPIPVSADENVQLFPVDDGNIYDQSPFDGVGEIVDHDLTNDATLNPGIIEVRGAMEFDLSSITPNNTIESAYLNVTPIGREVPPNTSSIPIYLFGYSGDGTIGPDDFTAGNGITIFDGLTAPTGVPIILDVTDFLQNLGPTNYVGFSLRTGVPGGVTFGSLEIGPTPTLNITLAPLITEVSIDIRPGSEINPINTTSKGKIPVAILSTADFDAPLMVDKTSLTFGRTGDETSLAFCNKGSEDVNNDGLQDQVCHFYNQETGFQVGDVEGILKGQTVDGVPIEGNDKISIVNASSEEFNVCPFEPIMITLTSPNPVKVPVQITSSGQDLNFAATDPPGIFWSLTALDNTDLFAGGPDDHVHFAWYGFSGDPGYYYVVFDHPGAGTTYPTIQVNLACDYEAPEP